MGYDFYAYLDRMKYIKRWQLMRSTREENIMEHSQERRRSRARARDDSQRNLRGKRGRFENGAVRPVSRNERSDDGGSAHADQIL